MKRRLKLIVVVFLAAGLFAFAWFDFTRDTVFVYDAGTQKPIVGAMVTLEYPSFNGRSYMTSSSGIVRLWEGLPDYGVEVSKDGYYSETTMTVLPAAHQHHLRIGLKPK